MPLGPTTIGNTNLGWRESAGGMSGTPPPEEDEAGENPQDDQPIQPKPNKPTHHVITAPDGTVSVIEMPKDGMAMYTGHFGNLADKLDASYLSTLGADLVQAVEDDEQSRSEWTAMRTKGVDLLYLKMEEPGSETNNGNISRVGNSSMLDACVRYQSNFIGEILPITGPAKVEDDSQQTGADRDEIADAFEKDVNWYLTKVDKDYAPDRDRGSFRQALDGCIFTKGFHCPVRRRPALDVIYATDMIVSNDATSVRSAARVTHRSFMSQDMMKRMQILGVREAPLQSPTEEPDEMTSKIKSTEGQSPTPVSTDQADQRHENYEIYVNMIIKGDEHDEGLARPYRITVERESSAVLEIRRNWAEADTEEFKPLTKIVMWPLIPGLGFYPYGFAHLIGNTTRALTAIMRLLIDAGMFASFPGWLRAKMGSRQQTNQIRIMPSGSQEIETGGLPLSDVVMPLPYKDPSVSLSNFYTTLEASARNLAGAIEVPVGDGKADIPVGTMMALIEQSTKNIAAIHKRNHRAQGEELEYLKQLFCEDPQALHFFDNKSGRIWAAKEEFEDLNLVPASDPNIPSHVHRLMQVTAVVSRADTHPDLYDKKAVEEWALRSIGVSNPQSLLMKPLPPGMAPPGPPAPPDPLKVIALQSQAREAEQTREIQQGVISDKNKLELKQMDVADREKERQNRMAVAQIDLHKEIISAHSAAHSTNADLLAGAHDNMTQVHTNEHDLANTHVEGHHAHRVAKEQTVAEKAAAKGSLDSAKETSRGALAAAKEANKPKRVAEPEAPGAAVKPVNKSGPKGKRKPKS